MGKNILRLFPLKSAYAVCVFHYIAIIFLLLDMMPDYPCRPLSKLLCNHSVVLLFFSPRGFNLYCVILNCLTLRTCHKVVYTERCVFISVALRQKPINFRLVPTHFHYPSDYI